MPPSVLIAGGGPAALRAALALHRFSGADAEPDPARHLPVPS
jgi:hypothetical protein